MQTIELTIEGKVQGVFFRASAQQYAQSLGLSGWVKNLSSGAVQLRASGSREALQKMEAWCAQGPPEAEVMQVSRKEISPEHFEGFRIIR